MVNCNEGKEKGEGNGRFINGNTKEHQTRKRMDYTGKAHNRQGEQRAKEN